MMPESKRSSEVVTFAGGCFWCLQPVFQELRGVEKVEVGYSGGRLVNPSYEAVCTDTTGHAEAVQVTFDPTVIPLADILRIFFSVHDPTTLNRQGGDVGTQYRSAIFYNSPEQEKTARQVMAEIFKAGIWGRPIVTEVTPLQPFYRAEEYHQDHFLAIKVDRDERPDIDARYQQAVFAIAGQGGWPLTAFLTPDGKVFYGGTYFPPKDSYGRPSFRRVLLAMADAYRTNKADTVREAEALHQALAEGRVSLVEEGAVNEAMLKESLDSLRGQFDPVNGGIAGQQKFPHPGTMEWVMARYHRTREEGFQKIFTRTLSSMAKGGVYDQIGGGFHRYPTDPRWIVPHFEKMLYDNAGLLANYVHAWQLTRDPLYREIAEGILAWSEEVLSDRRRGGYFASQDADVGLDDDGDYFTWTLDELKVAVNVDEARVLALYFEVATRGEMHHDPKKNVLFVDQEPEAIAKSVDTSTDRVRDLVASGKRKLKIARDKRPMPGVDHTIFASWNGMMITAALDAAMAFDREDVRVFALKSLQRVLSEMWSKDRGMWHALADGERKVRGLLEDQ